MPPRLSGLGSAADQPEQNSRKRETTKSEKQWPLLRPHNLQAQTVWASRPCFSAVVCPIPRPHRCTPSPFPPKQLARCSWNSSPIPVTGLGPQLGGRVKELSSDKSSIGSTDCLRLVFSYQTPEGQLGGEGGRCVRM